MLSSDLHIEVRTSLRKTFPLPWACQVMATVTVGKKCFQKASHLCPIPRPKWKMGLYSLLPRDKREHDICHQHRRMAGL